MKTPAFPALVLVALSGMAFAQSKDPGPRGPVLPVFMVNMIDGNVSPSDAALFSQGLAEFRKFNSVKGTFQSPVGVMPGVGLGPRFNSFSCGDCHVSPVFGGSSGKFNNQPTLVNGIGTDYGTLAPGQTAPAFLQRNGPSMAVRFKYNPDQTRDGSVHQFFTISGRPDAPGCSIQQPDFATQAQNNNIAIRVTTPAYGDGLIEAIPDAAILGNKNANVAAKLALGISGHENRDPHTALISKFGWKAQIRVLRDFSGDAFRNEMGVTNDVSTTSNDSAPGCQFNAGLEDVPTQTASGIETRVDLVTAFMRFLAPPKPAAPSGSASNGMALFNQIGCALCHTAAMNTGAAVSPALANRAVNLYSDLLVHHMGSGLMDDIIQGSAGPDEFRTAPLWGLGQRFYFLHDGRTADLKAAIAAHSGSGSEATNVVNHWLALTEAQKQDLLNFLRSL